MKTKFTLRKPGSLLAEWVVGQDLLFADLADPLENIQREVEFAVVTGVVHGGHQVIKSLSH